MVSPKAAVLARDDGAFEGLQTLLVAFLDADVDADGIARSKLGYLLAFVRVLDFLQQRILHGGSP